MKRFLGILISGALLCCLSVGAVASTPVTSGVAAVNAAGFEAELAASVGKTGGVSVTGTSIPAITNIDQLVGLEVRPGTEIRIRLNANMFLDRNGAALSTATDAPAVSLGALTSGSIKLNNNTPQGRNMSNITLGGSSSGSYISIVFNEGLQNVGGSFDYSIYLANNNNRVTETLIRVTGKVTTDIFDIDSHDYVDTSNGDGARAQDSTRGVSFFIGENITITINTTRGRTYYGMATTDTSTRLENVLSKYGSIADIYRLQTVGLKTAGNNVRIDLPNTYHVYNTYGMYIGTTADALPYWTTYFISTEKYEMLDV